MGSKKHKKDSKKKKHRSRSRSPIDVEERERKRHRKHKDRKKDRSPDVEEVPVDSHLRRDDRSDSSSVERDRRMREQHRATEVTVIRKKVYNHERDYDNENELDLDLERDRLLEQDRGHERDRVYERDRNDEGARERGRDREYERDVERSREQGRDKQRSREETKEKEPSPMPVSSKAQESLSIEETNKLRAKLGLKPLEVTEQPAGDDGKIKDDLGEFYHKPAENITQQKKAEKLKEKLELRKEKRKLEQKLQTKPLGEESDEDDPMSWVAKSRALEKAKREAAARAAALDQMDAEFGVSALLQEDQRETRQRAYTHNHLKGLRVAHDINALGDEGETILTLADKDVLAEDNEDVLVNVNLVDNEKYKKNQEELKKARSGYQAYDDEADFEAVALGLPRSVLAKYDDEIDKEQGNKQKGFLIGDDDAIEAKKFREMMRAERMAGGADRRLESLQLPQMQIASDYMDHHEIEARFKKTKRKGKLRKKAKQEPIDVDDYEAGNAPLHTDDTEVKPEELGSGLVVDDEETEPDTELQAALARARRTTQQEMKHRVPKLEEILESVPPVEQEEDNEDEGRGGMVFDATAEFCRTLGDIPTYGLAGNRDTRAEIIDYEREMEPEMETEPEGAAAGAWSRVDVHSDQPPDLTAGSSVALDAEPSVGRGVAGALHVALSKGYLERAGAAPATRLAEHAHLLHARHYSIEDKTYGEDDKHGRRERGGHSGPLQEFREKAHFRPAIKLEYVDDEGRPLCPKEAFRYLSHKFHGKGPGKNKQEKRIKKAVQEGLMKKMSSTDTPLGTLQMLQDKQRETHSPYVLLSGLKREQNN